MLVKCKVFHGKACKMAKQLIDDLLHEQWQMSVMSFKEMIDSANSKAYLCHHCYNNTKKCVDLIDIVRQSAGDLLNMASQLTAIPSTLLSCRKRLASTRDNPTIGTAVVQSGGTESVGEFSSISQTSVNYFVVGGTPSRMPPASQTNMYSTAQETNKSPAVTVSWINEKYTVMLHIY